MPCRPKNRFSFGEKIKGIRLQMGMRLSDLARKAGYSISYLSQLENNKIAPSVESLYKLSSVFGRPVGYFFDNFGNHADFVVKKHNRKKMLLDDGQIQFELLSSNLQKKSMEALVVRMKKGHTSPEKTHVGEEVGLVIKGRICVTLAGIEHMLEEGDSIYYSATTPHVIKNTGNSEAVLFWVMTPPNF
jgi:transcriptional regulator with XRE-family HTH domain